MDPLPETQALVRVIVGGAALSLSRPRPRREIPLSLYYPPMLVGREEAWARMEKAWGAGRLVFLAGEPGIGKTRLLKDFASTKGSFVWMSGLSGDQGTRSCQDLCLRLPLQSSTPAICKVA